MIDNYIDYPSQYEMDSVYFRVKRNGTWDSVCFSDLTEDEMEDVFKDKNVDWYQQLCKILAGRLRSIAEEIQEESEWDDLNYWRDMDD